jgi:hypothetical protein
MLTLLRSMTLNSLFSLFLISIPVATHAQLIVEDDFESLSEGPLATNSVSGSGQWTGPWTIADNQRIKVAANAPGFSKTSPGLGTIHGAAKCLELKTSTGLSVATRPYQPIDIPFYVSFLLSAVDIGTGGGYVDLVFLKSSGVGSLENRVLSIQPRFEDSSGAVYSPNWSSSGGQLASLPIVPRGTPILVVLTVPKEQTNGASEVRINPTLSTTYFRSDSNFGSGFFSRIAFRAGRTSTSGTDSTFRIDQLRVGLQRKDVVPDAPAGNIISNPTLEIMPRVSFFAATGKSYYIQRSSDMKSWITRATMTGNGTLMKWTDPEEASRAFYRIVVSP